MKNTEYPYSEIDLAEAFRLLSEFYQLPTEGMDSKLRALEGRMTKVCRIAASHVFKMRAYFEKEGDVESLQVEFSKLFLGPFSVPAPPYGSVYLDGDRSLMGQSTVNVLDRYKQEGLNTSKNFHDAPDHITAELEFVYFLNMKALEAVKNAERDVQKRYIEKRKHFLMDHLGAWISDFERNVEKNAETEFYTNLIKATKALIQKDLQTLSRCYFTRGADEQGTTLGSNPDAF